MPTQSRPINSGQRRCLGHLAIPGHLAAMHMGRCIVNMDTETVINELRALINLRNRTRRNIAQMTTELGLLEEAAFRNYGHTVFEGRGTWAQRLLLLMDNEACYSRILVHLMQEVLYRDINALFEGQLP